MADGGMSVTIRRLRPEDAKALLQLRLRNREFVRPWEPLRPETQFREDWQRRSLLDLQEKWDAGREYGFGVFAHSSDELIGRVTLSNVARGAWQSCTLGYFLDERHNGRGLMTEAARLAVAFAFEEAGLHRVQAGVMPRNRGSVRVLEKVGFRYEGLAEYYVQINGVWEDHGIYSITREHYEMDRSRRPT